MKSLLPFLRLGAFLCLVTSAGVVKAKPCIGNLSISLQHANGTVTNLYWGFGDYNSTIDLAVTLLMGDTVLITHSSFGDCSMNGGMRVRRSMYPDTATAASPVIIGFTYGQIEVKIAQRGSYFLTSMEFDSFHTAMRLSIYTDEEAVPSPVALQFTKESTAQTLYPESYPALAFVPATDTCSGPCTTAYLLDGQFVRMQALSNGMAQEGGNVIVRYAPDGETVDFGSPETIIPLVGSEGYQFSEDGIYLLSVEGPLFTATGYAYVRISHLPAPRVDMSLTIERADGTTEDLDFSQWDHNIDLGAGDSLRIDHHEITEPCSTVRLNTYVSPNWGPAYPQLELAYTVTPSTSAGIRMAAPGSYRLAHRTDCAVPITQNYLTINAPAPQRDLIVRLRHSNGEQEELYRSPAPILPAPEFEVQLHPGDSISLLFEETGWCSSPWSASINRTDGSFLGEYIGSFGRDQEFIFSDTSRFRVRLYGGTCYYAQYIFLNLTRTLPAEIDLQVDQVLADGTSLPLTYAEAGGSIVFTDIALAADDSIKVSGVSDQELCNNLALKIYRAATDTASVLDPVFLDGPLLASGLNFREVGALLLTLEDTCGTVTASAHLTVSADISTGIAAQSQARFNARYFNDLLFVDTTTGGQLQVRNATGQLVREVALAGGTMLRAIPFTGEAGGVYLATLRGSSHVDVFRFAVY